MASKTIQSESQAGETFLDTNILLVSDIYIHIFNFQEPENLRKKSVSVVNVINIENQSVKVWKKEATVTKNPFETLPPLWP